MSEDRLNLLDALAKGSYQHAILCTFSFEPRFFESYCLERLDAVGRTPNVTVITDRAIWQEATDTRGIDRPREANVRYLLQPINAAGVFHPKLWLFAGKKSGRLVIGSANLTESGLSSNAELAAVFDFAKDGKDSALPLFRLAYAFLLQLADRSKGITLKSNIAAVSRDAPWLVEPVIQKHGAVSLLHNLSEPLWDQIFTDDLAPLDRLIVVSRYFDAAPTLLDHVSAQLKPIETRLVTDESRTTLTRDWLTHPMLDSGAARVDLMSVLDGDRYQPLHAKALYFERNGRGSLVFGSANFTTAALRRTAVSGNVEVVVLCKGLDPKEISDRQLLDPCGLARPLADASDLPPPRLEEDEPDPSLIPDFHLHEALFEEDHLNIIADDIGSLGDGSILGRLAFVDDSRGLISVSPSNDGRYIAPVSERLRARLDRGSTVLHLELVGDGRAVLRSNGVLVTNLRDYKTGASLRQTRRLREAQEGRNQFLYVLSELLSSKDEGPLLSFLSACNIPIQELNIPPYLRLRQRPPWVGQERMRGLGKLNLVIYKQLHDATLAFFDRHFRKLKRHVESGSIKGASNYLHIFFAMGDVLRAQADRLITGLESKDDPLTVSEWHKIRKDLGLYYRRLRELLECLLDEYLPQLSVDYGSAAVREEFHDQLADLHELTDGMFHLRDRLEMVRQKQLQLQLDNALRDVRTPPYFPRDLVGDAEWLRYREGIVELMREREKLIA